CPSAVTGGRVWGPGWQDRRGRIGGSPRAAPHARPPGVSLRDAGDTLLPTWWALAVWPIPNAFFCCAPDSAVHTNAGYDGCLDSPLTIGRESERIARVTRSSADCDNVTDNMTGRATGHEFHATASVRSIANFASVHHRPCAKIQSRITPSRRMPILSMTRKQARFSTATSAAMRLSGSF